MKRAILYIFLIGVGFLTAFGLWYAASSTSAQDASPTAVPTVIPIPTVEVLPTTSATVCTVFRLQDAMARLGPDGYIKEAAEMAAQGCSFVDLNKGDTFTCRAPVCIIVGEYNDTVAGVDDLVGSVPSRYGEWPAAVLHPTWVVTGLEPGMRVFYNLEPTLP